MHENAHDMYKNRYVPSLVVAKIYSLTLMDWNLTFYEQINNLCKTCFYFLYNIRKVRKHLTKDVTATLVHALEMSRLNYCKSATVYCMDYRPIKLQNYRSRVQNTSARLVNMIPKFTRISRYLKELHWLLVKFRIEFKITILTLQASHGLAPKAKYLCELVRIKEQSTYHLRSSEKIILVQPYEKSLLLDLAMDDGIVCQRIRDF